MAMPTSGSERPPLHHHRRRRRHYKIQANTIITRTSPDPDTHAAQPSDLVRRRGGALAALQGKFRLPVDKDDNGACQTRRLTKLLLNVNIQNSLGPIKVVMLSDNTVGDLVKAAIDAYVREQRRPLLASVDPRCFGLHYSQFSLQSLKVEEKLINLGSRNFFMCGKHTNNAASVSSCSGVAKAAIKSSFSWTRLMDFLL